MSDNDCLGLVPSQQCSQQQSSERKRREYAEWEEQKETIFHLYIDEGLDLRQVAQIMRERHGFDRSELTYKKWFKYWGCRKNLDGGGVDDFAAQVQRHIQHGAELPFSIHDKPVQELMNMRRTWRRKKLYPEVQSWILKLAKEKTQKGKQVCRSQRSSPQLPGSVANIETRTGPLLESIGSPPRDRFEPDGLEVVLFETRQYLEHRLDTISAAPASLIRARRLEGDRFNDLLLLVLKGCQYVSLKPTAHGHGLINQGLEMAKSALCQQNVNLPQLMVRMFAHRRWRYLPGLRDSLFDFLTSMSRRELGHSHPITTIFEQLRCTETTMNARMPVLKVMLEVMKARPRPNSDEIHNVEMDLVDGLTIQKDLDEARVFCEQLGSEYCRKYGPNHFRTRRLMLKLARLYHQQDRNAEAEGLWNQVVRLDLLRDGLSDVDFTAILACEDLAKFYQQQEEYCLSEGFWRQALRWTVQSETNRDFFSLQYFNGLFNVLVLKGDLTEARDLQRSFPELAAYQDFDG